MRAGCFAETRVINLLNSRFVPFFFNRGGPGKGKDEAARKFTVGKTKNKYAYFAAFTPGGKYLGETKIYADKDDVFEWLCGLLDKHPKFAAVPNHEQATLDAAKKKDCDPDLLHAAAVFYAETGKYNEACSAYERILADRQAASRLHEQAWIALLRIARYLKTWDQHQKIEEQARQAKVKISAHLDVEGGLRSIGRKDYKAARKLLVAAARKHRASIRASEAHFYAGVACWFMKDYEWAKFHWCWVVKNLPEDRLYMRAYIAAATDSMPYPNAELGGHTADCGMIGTGHIVKEVARSMQTHRRLLQAWRTR